MAKSDSRSKTFPDYSLEQHHHSRGFHHIAGIDEAGRGPLAGPVVAAAVILDPHNYPDGLNDSKKLTAKRRETLFSHIISSATVCIASAPPHLIATLNIRGATLWAMRTAVAGLSTATDFALIDGRDIPPGLTCPAEAVIKGDSRSVSIAAASIIAKVTRDRMCATLESDHPEFGFTSHKGYGTAFHLSAIETIGPTRHHREEFAPVARALRLINPTD